MKEKAILIKFKLCIIFLLGFGLTGVMAQENVNATGGEATGSGGSASYSVGQVFYNTNTGTNGSVAQGVQQPFEISVLVGIEEANAINLSVSAYPNPTDDYLTLRVDDFDMSDLSYQLYDLKGKCLQAKKLAGTETQIEMRSYVQSTYFVKVYAVERNDRTGVIQGNREVKTFKIVKN